MYYITQQHSRIGPEISGPWRDRPFDAIDGPFATKAEALRAAEAAVAAYRDQRLTAAQRVCTIRDLPVQNIGTLYEPILKAPRCPSCGVVYEPVFGNRWRHP